MIEHFNQCEALVGSNQLRQRNIRNAIDRERTIQNSKNADVQLHACAPVTSATQPSAPPRENCESQARCHSCGVVGHYANRCPLRPRKSIHLLDQYSDSEAQSDYLEKDSLKDQVEE